MEEETMKETSGWWWIDSQFCLKRSPWLQSTLSELDAKTKAMLKLIEQDADSFAQRAEMYYQKRPQLVTMMEDWYRSQRSLAEGYDQLRSKHGKPNLTSSGSPFWSEKPAILNYQQKPDVCSESCISEEYPESDVEDPDIEFETNCCDVIGDDQNLVLGLSKARMGDYDETVELNEEIKRLKEEIRVQDEELKKKDEEKREVIRQLSLAVDMLKDENSRLRKRVSAASSASKEECSRKSRSPVLEFKNLRNGFLPSLNIGFLGS